MTGVLIWRGDWNTDTHKNNPITEERCDQDTARRQPSASQKERPRKKPNLLTYFRLLTYRIVRKLIYCLNHPVCGIDNLLWHPSQTDTWYNSYMWSPLVATLNNVMKFKQFFQRASYAQQAAHIWPLCQFLLNLTLVFSAAANKLASQSREILSA